MARAGRPRLNVRDDLILKIKLVYMDIVYRDMVDIGVVGIDMVGLSIGYYPTPLINGNHLRSGGSSVNCALLLASLSMLIIIIELSSSSSTQ